MSGVHCAVLQQRYLLLFFLVARKLVEIREFLTEGLEGRLVGQRYNQTQVLMTGTGCPRRKYVPD